MNFFFGFNNKIFRTKLTIPKFQNRNKKITTYDLYQAYIQQNKWIIDKINKKDEDNDFFLINHHDSCNEKIYFLADKNQVKDNSINQLMSYNNFTNTSPDYRCNLQVSINNGGFSSYQSDYPYSMTTKNGNIMSSCSSLTNKDADENYVILKNIFHQPIKEKFNVFFINVVTNKIIKKIDAYTNFSNIFKLEKELINSNIYLFTDKYIGIPIFLSIRDNHLSFEHTHPPHTFIMGKNQFKIISKVKNEFRKIIS